MENLPRLAAELSETIRSSAEAYRLHAPDFDPVGQLSPDEPKLSRLLVYLLDPRGTHGQGDALLRQFLALIDEPLPEGQHVEVVPEFATTSGRRIDIVIRIGDRAIGIEHKPWAEESPAQCEDYARHLDAEFHGNYKLVFLTGDGRRSCTAGPYASCVAPLAWSQLEALQADSVRVQAFLEALFAYVRKTITGGPQMSTHDRNIMEHVLQPEFLDTTLQIVTRATALRMVIITERFGAAVLARLRRDLGPDWQMHTIHPSWDDAYGGIVYYLPGWKGRYGIYFSNQKPHGAAVGFGVWCWDDRVKGTPLEEEMSWVTPRLNEALQVEARGTEYWIWYKPLQELGLRKYDNWYEASTLKLLAGGQAVEELYPLVRRTAEVLTSRPPGAPGI